jgi:hypothetical protein
MTRVGVYVGRGKGYNGYNGFSNPSYRVSTNILYNYILH